MRVLSRWPKSALVGCLVLAVLPRAARAEQPAPAQCTTAFSRAPNLVKEGKLLEAKAELQRCATDPCPSSMRALCLDDLGQLTRRIPSIVLAARTSDGKDLSRARVSEHGAVVARALDGRSLEVDPGDHTYLFEADGLAPVEARVVVSEADRTRSVVATFAPAAPAPVAEAPVVTRRPIPASVWVVGGTSIALTAAWAGVGLYGLDRRSDLDACKGACDASRVSTTRATLITADVLLGVAIAGYAVTAILFATRPTVTSRTASAPWPLQF